MDVLHLEINLNCRFRSKKMKDKEWGETFRAVKRESERWSHKVCLGLVLLLRLLWNWVKSFSYADYNQERSRVFRPGPLALSLSSPRNVPLQGKILTAPPLQVELNKKQ